MGWAKQELGHVRELVRDGLYSTEAEAVAALKERGVPLAGRVFLRAALRVALSLSAQTKRLSEDDESVSVLRAALTPFGITIDEVVAGRTPLVRLSAVAPRRILALGESDGDALAVEGGAARPWGRVYATTSRRRGLAQFSANAFRTAKAPDVYFFVLLDERRVWMARKEDLRVFEDEVRSLVKHARPHAEARHGIGVQENVPGSIRLWFPREEVLDAFHLSMRIADEKLRLFGLPRRG